jgi:hypothetical protein
LFDLDKKRFFLQDLQEDLNVLFDYRDLLGADLTQLGLKAPLRVCMLVVNLIQFLLNSLPKILDPLIVLLPAMFLPILKLVQGPRRVVFNPLHIFPQRLKVQVKLCSYLFDGLSDGFETFTHWYSNVIPCVWFYSRQM